MEHHQLGYLNNDFRTCLAQLMEFGMVAQPRGTTTRELLNYNITLKAARNRIIHFHDRKTSLRYLLGEFIWYVNGSSDPAGILPYAKFWDGIRNSGNMPGYEVGTVNSNYGNRIFGMHDETVVPEMVITSVPAGVDPVYQDVIVNHDVITVKGISQWEATQKLLAKDKDTRQAIMNIHLPADRHDGNKDVPCTLTLHFFIREDQLHLIVNMRSNDVILGFTNDVFQFTMLQEAMAVSLREVYPKLDVGMYFHNAGSMHIYDRHFEMAGKIIADEKALDLAMIPMDVFDQPTALNLKHVNDAWVQAGMPKDYDFNTLEAFKSLSPYWQTLVLLCFNEDHDAFHAIYGIPHED
jgi:thymidylate synthase